jgi:cyclase
MLTRRIIPCLDVANGRVVKGIKFRQLRKLGDPVTCAARYSDQGADELVFLDISASSERRSTRFDWVRSIAERIFIPFTVGGGIGSLRDMEKLLESGADKVSINTAAVERPALIREAARAFGSQFVVISIDALGNGGKWSVTTHGARQIHRLDALAWAKRAQDLGAGEVLLNVINSDGTQEGYDLDLTRRFSESLEIPIIASGGAGRLEDFLKVFTEGKADAALAASVFHFRKLTVGQVKRFLKGEGIPVRFEEAA